MITVLWWYASLVYRRHFIANNAMIIVPVIRSHNTKQSTQWTKSYSHQESKRQSYGTLDSLSYLWTTSMSHKCNFTVKDFCGNFLLLFLLWFSFVRFNGCLHAYTHRRNIPFGRGVESKPWLLFFFRSFTRQIA